MIGLACPYLNNENIKMEQKLVKVHDILYS